MAKMLWKLSPSDFSFLWECKRCFYLKVVHDVKQVSMPLPGVFTRIAGMEKNFFDNKSTKDISPELPKGKVIYGEKRVRFQLVSFTDIDGECYISGRFDNVVELDSGGYGIIDFKTAETKADHIPLYSRQLHAYAYALEHPAENALSLSPIRLLGLCCLNPNEMFADNEKFGFSCESKWMECWIDQEGFLAFLREVMAILSDPEPPLGKYDCQWCQYRDFARRSGF